MLKQINQTKNVNKLIMIKNKKKEEEEENNFSNK